MTSEPVDAPGGSISARSRFRFLVGFVVVAVVVALALRQLDRPQPIYAYRVIDARTIGIETETGSAMWSRVTSVTETESSVTVTVSAFGGLPSNTGQTTELRVELKAPLGDRSVIDGTTGKAVAVTNCPQSMWAQGNCPGESNPPATP
jgi:hypothetical protein